MRPFQLNVKKNIIDLGHIIRDYEFDDKSVVYPAI